jgi:hypothetical protein
LDSGDRSGELQKPLVGKGEPDIELLQPYFEQVAADIGIELTHGQLDAVAQDLFAHLFCQDGSVHQVRAGAAALFAAAGQLVRRCEVSRHFGRGAGDTKSEKLLQIFVMPDVKNEAAILTNLGFKEKLLNSRDKIKKTRFQSLNGSIQLVS